MRFIHIFLFFMYIRSEYIFSKCVSDLEVELCERVGICIESIHDVSK